MAVSCWTSDDGRLPSVEPLEENDGGVIELSLEREVCCCICWLRELPVLVGVPKLPASIFKFRDELQNGEKSVSIRFHSSRRQQRVSTNLPASRCEFSTFLVKEATLPVTAVTHLSCLATGGPLLLLLKLLLLLFLLFPHLTTPLLAPQLVTILPCGKSRRWATVRKEIRNNYPHIINEADR